MLCLCLRGSAAACCYLCVSFPLHHSPPGTLQGLREVVLKKPLLKHPPLRPPLRCLAASRKVSVWLGLCGRVGGGSRQSEFCQDPPASSVGDLRVAVRWCSENLRGEVSCGTVLSRLRRV